jgi:Alkaline phosphatase PhoX
LLRVEFFSRARYENLPSALRELGKDVIRTLRPVRRVLESDEPLQDWHSSDKGGAMKRKSLWFSFVAAAVGVAWFGIRATADGPFDFGAAVEDALAENSLELFGVGTPLKESALGPYDGADSALAVIAAKGLRVSVVSTATHPDSDMIALWPNDDRPTHLFTCGEFTQPTNDPPLPVVERIDLSQPANANVTYIVSGVTSCDPVHRTPWGTIIVGEEAGATGGFYEIMDPAGAFPTPAVVTNRNAGATTDPRVVKRKAVGSLSFEGIVILPNGTMYLGDELRPGTNPPSSGSRGGAIYKFVPQFPYGGVGVITDPALSPFASGSLYGMRIGNGTGNNTDYGQGTEIGQGVWLPIDSANFTDGNGNIILRNAQVSLNLTGYYRPEDYDLDPIALARGEVRFCGANTGRVSNGGGSDVETASTYGEVICITDVPDLQAATGANPVVRRFISGDTQAEMFDNVAFQPHTGNLVVLEDGEVSVVKKAGATQTTELRGNDIWMCLPDGDDRDVQSDGCIRILSLTDTTSEPTGFIFTGSGRTAYVNIQHRGTGIGALLKITGFKILNDRDELFHSGP